MSRFAVVTALLTNMQKVRLHQRHLNLIRATALASALSLPACADDSEPLSGEEVAWIPIPAGTFEMGCSEGDSDCDHSGFGFGETPRHTVDLSAFEMTQTEITQYQY